MSSTSLKQQNYVDQSQRRMRYNKASTFYEKNPEQNKVYGKKTCIFLFFWVSPQIDKKTRTRLLRAH